MSAVTKLFVIYCLSNLFWLTAHGQKVAVENQRYHLTFPGINTPLMIVANEIPCDQLVITTDNGEITNEGNCQFNYIAKTVGPAHIRILRVTKGDSVHVAERNYQIIPWRLFKTSQPPLFKLYPSFFLIDSIVILGLNIKK